MRNLTGSIAIAAVVILSCCAMTRAVDNISYNPGFLDTDSNGELADGWGSFGAASFNDFWGGNPHASFYGDNTGNTGGVFQAGIPAIPGLSYQFILNNVRIEENWDADLIFGLEYYADDDATKLGETVVTADTDTRTTQGRVDDNVFAMTGISVAGTAFVRPIIRFENVNSSYSGQSQAALFVFNTFLSIVPQPGQEYLINGGFGDIDGDTDLGDYWGVYGAAGFNDFFGDPHASLFGDTIGNFGGLYQQGIIAKPGKTYLLSLDNVRVEENFDGQLAFGLEYYAEDDFTKLGETIVDINTALTGNGLAYAMSGTVVSGAAFVRPVVFFDNVLSDGEQRNVFIFEASLTEPAPGINIARNPGFDDVDTNGELGDYWGVYGTTDFNDFWGGNPHASLFADWFDCGGGIFQTGLPGVPGETYQFDLRDTRIEENWDADLRFGMEFYEADDATKIGETLVLVDTATRIANGQVDGNVLSMTAAAPVGTVFVRPIISFDNVNEDYLNESQASTFVFRTHLGKAPQRDQQRLKNPDFYDVDGDGNYGDYWGVYGTAGFNDYWTGNPHASFFAETVGDSGGIYQQAVLGTPGAQYQFELTNVRIEDNFDADLFFGLEYFGEDDFVKLGESVVQVDTSVTGDGLSYTMTGTAVAGTVYIRPIVFFDNVGTTGGEQRNAFIFASSLVKVTLPGDLDEDDDVDLVDYASFADCMAGPDTNPAPTAPLVPRDCFDNFDFDEDGDIDLSDAATFFASFTG